MKADYGYDVEVFGSERVLVVRQSRTRTRRHQAEVTFFLGVAVVVVTFGTEEILAGRHTANHGLSILVAATVVAATVAVLMRKAGQIKIRLAPDFIECAGQRYDRTDIQDVAVDAPRDRVVSGANAAQLENNRLIAEKLAAETFGVSFKYGRKRVMIAKKLTEEQASDICGELLSWQSQSSSVAA